MTVLSKSLKSEPIETDQIDLLDEETVTDQLSIKTTTRYEHPSPMPESLKLESRANAPSLLEIFHETVKVKGDQLTKREWVGDHTLEVEGLTQLTLHSFILEAEKLGKNVEYIKTFQVKISD